MGMNKENKKTEEDIQKSEENLNGSEHESELNEPDSEDESLGTPSYEELSQKLKKLINMALKDFLLSFYQLLII